MSDPIIAWWSPLEPEWFQADPSVPVFYEIEVPSAMFHGDAEEDS